MMTRDFSGVTTHLNFEPSDVGLVRGHLREVLLILASNEGDSEDIDLLLNECTELLLLARICLGDRLDGIRERAEELYALASNSQVDMLIPEESEGYLFAVS